jgi:DNA helicase-2/ATP-dependent DNA helicase PcrA
VADRYVLGGLTIVGERVFHRKFGDGDVTAVDGNTLTIPFDRAGERRVVDSFVERV